MDAARLLLRASLALIRCSLLLGAGGLREDVEVHVRLVDEGGIVDFNLPGLVGTRVVCGVGGCAQ